MEIFSLFFLAIIALLPILLWGYIFSYLDNSELNTKRFVMGIIAGAISVVPILFLQDFLRFFGMDAFDIFSALVEPGSFFLILFAFIATVVSIALMVSVISSGIFFESTRKSFSLLLKNTGILLALGVAYSLLHTIVFSGSFLDTPLKNGGISLGTTAYDSVRLVIFYYLVIGVIEESSKHFSMVTSSAISVDSVKKWVLFAIFIALGFGFIENILYLKNIASHSGLFDSGLYSTWIFRSIFSLIVHILCSATVALYFSRSLLGERSKNFLVYARMLLTGFVFSIALHAIFDVSLTIGFTGVIFVYFFFGYLSITRIFYRE